MVLVSILTFLTALVITILGVIIVKRLARLLHFVDDPGERKVHQHPIPLGGGIALFFGVFLTFIFAIVSVSLIKIYQPHWIPQTVYEYLPGVFIMIPRLVTIFIGGMIMFLLGLIDDIWGLNPWIKLVGQFIVAFFLVSSNIHLNLFLPDYIPGGAYFASIITIAWIILITNSLNLLDHMDGLSAGVTAVLSAIFLIAAYQTGQYFIASFLCAILGATIGFLIFNTHPASIFMGDAGSLLLGYLISVLTIIFTFYRTQTDYPFYVFFVPLLVVAVPLFDTISVIIIRLKHHKPIFKGDMNHLAHRLVGLGMGVRSAVLTIYLLTIGTGLPAVLLYFIRKEKSFVGGLIILFQVIILLIVITLLERAGRNSIKEHLENKTKNNS